MVFEQAPQAGGSLATLKRKNRWVLGFPDQTSQTIAAHYLDHIHREQITLLQPAEILSCRQPSQSFTLEFEHENKRLTVSIDSLVIATGIRPKGAESLSKIPGITELGDCSRLAFHPLSHLDQQASLANQTTVVIGGGDNACYTAQDLILAGARVHLITRSSLKAGAIIRKRIQKHINNNDITLHQPATIQYLQPRDQNILIQLDNGTEIIADWIFPRLGYTPNDAILNTLKLQVERDDSGYIRVNEHQQTSMAKIYAIGDIASPRHQSIVNALAQGAAAAAAISNHHE